MATYSMLNLLCILIGCPCPLIKKVRVVNCIICVPINVVVNVMYTILKPSWNEMGATKNRRHLVNSLSTNTLRVPHIVPQPCLHFNHTMSMINRTRVPKPKKFDQSTQIFYTIALFILSFRIRNHYNQLEFSHHLAFHNR